MRYRFVTADVFTDQAFGGNPVAVLPDGRGLDGVQMQAIAREFNLSETVFVLPPEQAGHSRRLRIFTPRSELPFAGHPTVGTALVLAELGEIELGGATMTIVLEEGAGPVPVTITVPDRGSRKAQLTAPQPVTLRAGPAPAIVADLLSLDAADLVTAQGLPLAASCGIPFLLVEVRDRAALGRASLDQAVFTEHLAGAWAKFPFLFTADALPGADLQARMFARAEGIEEDPATGSAAAAFGGWLGHTDSIRDGTLRRVFAQGIEMGRPSRLEVEVEKRAGETIAVRVAGSAVLISEGTILAPPAS